LIDRVIAVLEKAMTKNLKH